MGHQIIKQGDVIRIIPERGPERVVQVTHVQHRVITMTEIPAEETPADIEKQVISADLALMIIDFWKSHPSLTQLELAKFLAGQCADVLKYEIRARAREANTQSVDQDDADE